MYKFLVDESSGKKLSNFLKTNNFDVITEDKIRVRKIK